MHKQFALTPPMGWNSWDCYGDSVTEDILLANAAYMAAHLKEYGWEYVVCDIQWSEPTADGYAYHNFAPLCMDAFSRLLPAPERFPSAAGGKGFGPIAEKIHAMGLKFGIHIMRGIPRQAVHQNTPILCDGVTARQIAAQYSICPWNTDMYGVNPDAPGAQAYYDSLFALYAAWGVDYVKCDDIANTEFLKDQPYSARREIEMIRKAIDRCGRPIVLSLSPGPAPVAEHAHLAAHANLWRITGDFWDSWDRLHAMFDECARWQPYVQPGAWPDCDMLPLGHLQLCDRNAAGGAGRRTNFTQDEQITMMTLWSIFRSPLMIGAELRDCDEFTLSLLQNAELTELLKTSHGAWQYARCETDGRGEIIWCATGDACKYVALFNTDDVARTMTFDVTEITVGGAAYAVRDLWRHRLHCVTQDVFSAAVSPHGAALLRISRA